MFLLTLAVGLGLGWLLDHRRLDSQNSQLRESVDKACYTAGGFGWILRQNGYDTTWGRNENGFSMREPNGDTVFALYSSFKGLDEIEAAVQSKKIVHRRWNSK